MMWKVAPSYQKATIVRVNENDKKAYIEQKCDRCGGRGLIAARVENGHIIPIPVDGGVCYKCNGTGTIGIWVKAYTEKEYKSYVAAQEKAKERKAKAAEEKKQALMKESEENKKEKLVEFGYDPENPVIYMIVGNTYSIKDELKEMGCRFDRALGWYSAHPIEIPEGYFIATLPFDEAFDWNALNKRFYIKEGVKEVAEAAQMKVMPESKSEYIGEVKDRLRDLSVTLTGVRQMDGYYGTTTIYTFEMGDNVLVWMTSTSQNIEVGEHVLLTGTVKEHSEFRGVKQTKLSRCKIVKGA